MGFDITLRDIEEQWATRCYAELPWAYSRIDLLRAVAAFQEFLTLPQEVKQSCHRKLFAGDRGSDIGYKRCQRVDGKLDDKELFHVSRHAADFFGDHQHTTVQRFLRQALPLYGYAETMMRAVTSLFDFRFPGIGERCFPHGKFAHCYLRFVQYPATTGGNALAHGHFDRGVFTLAIAESESGLHIGRAYGQTQPVERMPEKALFFPSRRAIEVFGGCYPPAFHFVEPVAVQCHRPPRWAVVLFCDIDEPNTLQFEDTHYRG